MKISTFLETFQEKEYSFLLYLQTKRQRHFDCIMLKLTSLSNRGLIWFFVALVFSFFPDTRELGKAIVFALILHIILCHFLLKNLIARPRPEFANQLSINKSKNPKKDYSFPSGHTCSSFIAVSLFYLFGITGFYFVLFFALSVSFSRIYLGEHYPSDVLAGAIIGIVLGFLSFAIIT